MSGILSVVYFSWLLLVGTVQAQEHDSPCVLTLSTADTCDCTSYTVVNDRPVCTSTRFRIQLIPDQVFSRTRPWRFHTPEMWVTGLVLWTVGYAMSYVSYTAGSDPVNRAMAMVSSIPVVGGILTMDYYAARIESTTRGPSSLYAVWGTELASSITQIASLLFIIIGLAHPSGDRTTRRMSFNGTNLTVDF